MYYLENSIGSSGDLITIKTSDKKTTTEELRTSIENWMKNKYFNDFRDKLLDMAIVLHVDSYRYKRQDLDNMVKVIFDALQKRGNDNDRHYLFLDDSQVVRLLVYKIPRTEVKNSNTDYLQISFREHNSNKQMILVHKQFI